MDSARTRTMVQITAAAVALGLVIAGCGNDETSSSSSSSATSVTSATSATSAETSAAPTTAAAAADYTSLLMKPEDIPATPDGAFTADEPKTSTTPPPTDVSRNYKSGPNVINASVVINADAAAAATWLGAVAASLPTHQTGAPVPVPAVTPDATLTTGTDPEGKHASSAMLFTVDRFSVMILFVSPDGDLNPVPQDFAESVGKVQVAAIQAAAPALK